MNAAFKSYSTTRRKIRAQVAADLEYIYGGHEKSPPPEPKLSEEALMNSLVQNSVENVKQGEMYVDNLDIVLSTDNSTDVVPIDFEDPVSNFDISDDSSVDGDNLDTVDMA